MRTKGDNWWHIRGLVGDFIYEWADAEYLNEDPLLAIYRFIKDTGSQANPNNVMSRLRAIFKNACFAFDLPEHPEKHNGYVKAYQYEEKVLAVFGFSLPKPKSKVW
jgi:hypothetical protein